MATGGHYWVSACMCFAMDLKAIIATAKKNKKMDTENL